MLMYVRTCVACVARVVCLHELSIAASTGRCRLPLQKTSPRRVRMPNERERMHARTSRCRVCRVYSVTRADPCSSVQAHVETCGMDVTEVWWPERTSTSMDMSMQMDSADMSKHEV